MKIRVRVGNTEIEIEDQAFGGDSTIADRYKRQYVDHLHSRIQDMLNQAMQKESERVDTTE